jgi:ATP-dependent RNA helicase DDX24/MAK5
MHRSQKVDGQRAAVKAELRTMISQPLIARGISTKYVTSGSRPIDDLLACERKTFERPEEADPLLLVDESMLGLRKAKASDGLINVQRKKKQAQVPKVAEPS